jgi:glycerol-3-phosphate dehydrogenase (NAD(P)+)
MSSKRMSESAVGVIGAGSFGTAVANILGQKTRVLLYARKPEVAQRLAASRENLGQALHPRVEPTSDLARLGQECEVIFPIVPSVNFLPMIRMLAPYLKPYHMLIHGTKGILVTHEDWERQPEKVMVEDVCTMSQIIRNESLVVRIGCLAGPNLAPELAENQPAATVVASHFDEVIREGQRLLRTDRFQVYGSRDLLGIELCGVLKNIIAIAAGALRGLGLGENARSMLVSRGLIEMIYMGRLMGANVQPFLGLAGIGDLVATCSSEQSRNFSVGKRLAAGQKVTDILEQMDEVAEGVNTTRIMRHLVRNYPMRAPITETLYKVMWEELSVEEGLRFLMKSPFSIDIDFM